MEDDSWLHTGYRFNSGPDFTANVWASKRSIILSVEEESRDLARRDICLLTESTLFDPRRSYFGQKSVQNFP